MGNAENCFEVLLIVAKHWVVLPPALGALSRCSFHLGWAPDFAVSPHLQCWGRGRQACADCCLVQLPRAGPSVACDSGGVRGDQQPNLCCPDNRAESSLPYPHVLSSVPGLCYGTLRPGLAFVPPAAPHHSARRTLAAFLFTSVCVLCPLAHVPKNLYVT